MLDLAALLEEGESVSHYTSTLSAALYGHFRQMEELVEEAQAGGSVENYCPVAPGFRCWGSPLS